MAEEPIPRILVMDTGPLITLAVADSLDYLLVPGFPVIVPDAVFFEATRKSDAIGAESILEWVQLHANRVNIVPTSVYASNAVSLEGGGPRVPDMGERSAIEVVRYTPFATEQEVAILLTEDDEVVEGRHFSEDVRHRIVVVTTHDFLEGLEKARRINSVQAVYDRANDGGRMASKRQTEKEKYTRAMAALDAVLKTNGSKS